MRKSFFSVVAVSIVAAVAACVGDDPVTASSSNDASTDDASSTSDAGGDATGDSGADAALWTPAAFAGLVLWLDDESPDVAGGTEVVKWHDKSGKQNDALAATDASDVPPNVTTTAEGIGGRATVRFDGIGNYLYIPDAPTLRWGTGDFLIALVVREPSLDATASQFLYDKTTSVVSNGLPNPGPQVFLETYAPPYAASFFGGVDGNDAISTTMLDGGAAPDVGHIVRFRWINDATGTGGTMEIAVDGVATTSRLATPPNGDALGIDVSIGVTSLGRIAHFQGDISTIIAVNTATSDADVASLETYLKSRYGL